ncbi:hypothetical protein BC939DRAFT_475863 [Gamsiella multidivaricata]|uniref:uncharacterized protein n=1 Tax=Gamsiella multidivaricata TaxID=101098 RepID=UPI00221ECE54|nr:uncharacterized protein BC939DRAFT_475863 [Gamsiella multidivaricata]KAI7826170.1 hypothetical protein BC939DRAFT_475863 [Gamsiella multidivaricata]
MTSASSFFIPTEEYHSCIIYLKILKLSGPSGGSLRQVPEESDQCSDYLVKLDNAVMSKRRPQLNYLHSLVGMALAKLLSTVAAINLLLSSDLLVVSSINREFSGYLGSGLWRVNAELRCGALRAAKHELWVPLESSIAPLLHPHLGPAISTLDHMPKLCAPVKKG